ncbi:MAG: hypothetical protein R3C62_07020 [Chloroflexota bacterium]
MLREQGSMGGTAVIASVGDFERCWGQTTAASSLSNLGILLEQGMRRHGRSNMGLDILGWLVWGPSQQAFSLITGF